MENQVWYQKNIGKTANSLPQSMEILKAFMNYAVVHGDQTGAAIYSISDLPSNSVTIYFSPEASQLATAFEATPCDKPQASSRLSRIAGHDKGGGSHFRSE